MRLSRHLMVPVSLLAILPPLFWAGNFVLARAMHAEISPSALSFWRWALALLVILPFVYKAMWAQRALIRQHWAVLTLFAVLGITNYNTFAYFGLQTSPATNGVLLASAIPLIILALSFLIFRVPLSRLQLLGILLSLAGVLVILTEGRPALLADMTWNRGDLWLLAASLDWALYSVFLRWRPANMSPGAFLGAIIAIGVIPLVPLYAVDVLWWGNRLAVNAANISVIAYVAVFPSVLAYVFWNRAVQELGPNRTGQYIHLMPLFGAAMAIIFLGERLQLFHGIGALLIATGILLASFLNTKNT